MNINIEIQELPTATHSQVMHDGNFEKNKFFEFEFSSPLSFSSFFFSLTHGVSVTESTVLVTPTVRTKPAKAMTAWYRVGHHQNIDGATTSDKL